MSKLNKEELLEWFDRFVFSDIGSTVNRECVEGHEHCQAYQQIKELIQKPEVTEEFIKKWQEEFCACYDYPETGDLIELMLKEAGVHVS